MATPMALEGTEFDARAAFYNECENVVADFCRRGVRFTKDDVKDRVSVEPPHPNAWGGLHLQPWWKGKVVPTGDYTPSRNRKSKGHGVRVWEGSHVVSFED